MDDLATLLAKRKEINEKIRQLQQQTVICGCAKCDIEKYPTQKPDRHYIAVKSDYNEGTSQYVNGYRVDRNTQRWKTIINGASRSDLIEKIPPIINDLQSLYNTLKEDEND